MTKKRAKVAKPRRQQPAPKQRGWPPQLPGGLPATLLPTARLPSTLLDLPLANLALAPELARRLTKHALYTFGDLLRLPGDDGDAELPNADLDAVQDALGRLLAAWPEAPLPDALPEPVPTDWATARARLEACLDSDGRRLLVALLGLDAVPWTRAEVSRKLGVSWLQLDEQVSRVRANLVAGAPSLLTRLRYEALRELRAHGGSLVASDLRGDTLLHQLAHTSLDVQLVLRVCAFCLPRECHLHGDRLVGMPAARFRRLLRTLPTMVAQRRLPISITALAEALGKQNLHTPRPLLVHVLRHEFKVTVAVTDAIESAVPDPRSPSTRLADLLLEAGEPMQIENLVFAYRDHFRRASRVAIEQHLRGDRAFVMLGPSTWALRGRHEAELAAVAPYVERVVRHICEVGGRQSVAKVLAALSPEGMPSNRTPWFVLDRMASDLRVRMLGRGEACPAVHTRSKVFTQLLHDLRRAGSDVVTSMFLANQPASRRRLVERLLRWNRLFVSPARNRIDLLSNYPFNRERLQRLVRLLHKQLRQRSGYAQAAALKAVVDKTDLGGGWFTCELMMDLLRRHGRFEVLPGGMVARRDLGLRASVMRSARQALRDADYPIRVADLLRARPDLVEFASSLEELLRLDPLVRASETGYFSLL